MALKNVKPSSCSPKYSKIFSLVTHSSPWSIFAPFHQHPPSTLINLPLSSSRKMLCCGSVTSGYSNKMVSFWTDSQFAAIKSPSVRSLALATHSCESTCSCSRAFQLDLITACTRIRSCRCRAWKVKTSSMTPAGSSSLTRLGSCPSLHPSPRTKCCSSYGTQPSQTSHGWICARCKLTRSRYPST